MAMEGVQLVPRAGARRFFLAGQRCAGELAVAGKSGVTVQSSLEAVKDDFDVFIDFTRPEGTLDASGVLPPAW